MTDKIIELTDHYYTKDEIDEKFKSKKIPAHSDLNNYITTGFYYNNSNADCQTISNLPSANIAFFLIVEDWGTTNYTKQTCTAYSLNTTYIRIRSSGTWGTWVALSKTNHTHGNITSDGKIGSTANLPIITTTSGKLTTGSFGTTANTFCQGNDSRLSNARAPTSHSHGNITNDGKIGSTENKPIITTTNGTLSAGEFESTASNIKMNGTANVGSLNTFARADHIHPSDTNKSKVSISRSLTSGTKLGTITIDGTAVDLYSTNNTTYSAVTQSANGLMTSADKQKADKSMMIGFATAGGTTSAFTASITGATLTHGTIIAVYNAIGNNAANATLNVNSLGAKPIYYNASAITASRYPNKTTCLFMYNTTIVSSGCWQMIYSSDTNTTYTAASATPIMDGTGTVGTSAKYAREDHVHPSDTNKSKVSISRSLTSGTKLGTITIDGTATDLYSTNNTTYSVVTQSADGLMTKEDKQKADKSMMIGFGTASGTTSAYTVSITGTTLTHGTIIAVYNAIGNNAASATLNVNSLGAKPIYYNASAITAGRYPNKTTCLFMYNTSIVSGGCWQMIYSSDTNTTYTAATTSANGLMSSADKSKLDSSRAILNGVTDNTSSDEYKVTITGVTLTGGTLIAVLNNRGLSNNDGASLNVNNLGAKPIYYRNRPIKQGEFPYRSVGLFLYSGGWSAFNEGNGAWILIDEGDVYHKGIVDGGMNILGQHETANSSGATGVINRTTSLYHGEPVYQLDNTSLTDTTKYTDFKWTIGKNEFKYGDTFTLSFYAKGTSGKEIRTYFYGASGYINNRRLRSNSDVGDANIGGYGDGATRFTLTSDWKKYYVTYELNTTATTPTANKYILIRVFGGTNIQLACAKLERGEIATDYTPSTTPINIDYTIDYNDYTTEGHYHIWGGSNASSQVNNANRPPNDTQGGLLVVEKIPNGVIQKLYNYYMEKPKIYYRIYHYSAGWRAWQELGTIGNIGSYTNGTLTL